MSLRTNSGRNNSKGADERMVANQEKRCKVSSCDAYRHKFTGYCSIHGSRYGNYGDPHQIPLRLSDDYMSYYRATLKYIEDHEEELGDHLAKAEKLIRYPDLIKHYDISEMEKYNPPIDYRDKGRPLGHLVMSTLLRWNKDTRLSKHYLASVIAPHVYTYQEPEVLLGGRPVHMIITRSLLAQCRNESHTEWLPYDPEVKKIQFKKVYRTNKVGARDRANLGFRLTAMFTKVITQVYKEIPKVIDEEAKEYREKLEHYKMFEKMHREGDQRITKGDLERLRGNLGIQKCLK